MFRAWTCPSSGGKIVFTQHLLSSLSVNVCTVRYQQVYCADVYRERRYQMLCEYNFSSWRWACSCSKHVEDNSVTNILLMNKENCASKLVDEIILPSFLYFSSKFEECAIRYTYLYILHKTGSIMLRLESYTAINRRFLWAAVGSL